MSGSAGRGGDPTHVVSFNGDAKTTRRGMSAQRESVKVYTASNEEVDRYVEQETGKSSGYTVLIASMVVVLIGLFFVIAGIVLAAVMNGDDSMDKLIRELREMGGVLDVVHFIDEGMIWDTPDNIGRDGRAFVTMSGGGGGGCGGTGAVIGGGGNSGASAVNYPVVLPVGGSCVATIGEPGDTNADGGSTQLQCFPVGSGTPSFEMLVDGGRSGCVFFNSTYPPRLGSDSFPFVAERVGGRPVTMLLPESHPYGGLGGLGSGGGAGSVFGAGGKSGGVNVNGSPGVGYGSGGGGGGTGPFTIGGSGVGGAIEIVYSVDLDQS
jgi:hypothetical protein